MISLANYLILRSTLFIKVHAREVSEEIQIVDSLIRDGASFRRPTKIVTLAL